MKNVKDKMLAINLLLDEVEHRSAKILESNPGLNTMLVFANAINSIVIEMEAAQSTSKPHALGKPKEIFRENDSTSNQVTKPKKAATYH